MQKRTKLLALVDGGMPIQEAAKKLKIARSTAYEWVKRRDAEAKARTSEPDLASIQAAGGDPLAARIRAAQGEAVSALVGAVTDKRGTPAGRTRAARAVFDLARALPPAASPKVEARPIPWEELSVAELDVADALGAWIGGLDAPARVPYVVARDRHEWPGLTTAEAAELERLLVRVEQRRPLRIGGSR